MENTSTPRADAPLLRSFADNLIGSAVLFGTRFGDRKIFLSTIPGCDPKSPAGKAALDVVRRAGLVEFARADFVAAMDPALVAASEWDLGGGVTLHFLVLP